MHSDVVIPSVGGGEGQRAVVVANDNEAGFRDGFSDGVNHEAVGGVGGKEIRRFHIRISLQLFVGKHPSSQSECAARGTSDTSWEKPLNSGTVSDGRLAKNGLGAE